MTTRASLFALVLTIIVQDFFLISGMPGLNATLLSECSGAFCRPLLSLEIPVHFTDISQGADYQILAGK